MKFSNLVRIFVAALACQPVLATGGSRNKLDILLTNDDGFETEFIQALFFALEDAGHNVIMSAPYAGQSGTSGFIRFLQPILPTTEPSPGGALPAGSPGIGPTTLADGQYYADSTPAGAVLYGIDVLARDFFESRRPDLVISGPNEGQNVGLVTPHSGTMGAAVTAINKGIPTIAVSGPQTGNAELIAELTLMVVEATKGKIPVGNGWAVNIPELTSEDAGDYKFKYTFLGRASDFGLEFVESLADSPVAASLGIDVELPGVSIAVPYTSAGYPEDTKPKSEGNVFGRDLIVTMSPIEGLYAADSGIAEKMRLHLEGNLF